MVHSVSGWMRGEHVKLWDRLRTRATPERLRAPCHVHDKALNKSTFTFTLTYLSYMSISTDVHAAST